MRRRRRDHTKLTVCKSYEHLRRKWQSFLDGTTAQSDSQPLDEDAVMSAKKRMAEHRENCEVCKKEDLALKDGEVPTAASAEPS